MDKKINRGLEIQKVFALKEHVGSSWKNNLKNKPVGSSPHIIGNRGDKRLGDYNTYNLVWTNPDTGEVISKFVSVKPYNELFMKDIKLLSDKDIENLKIALNDLKLGYVFDDNDERVLKDRYDTSTHCLNSNRNIIKASQDCYLAYSKFISSANILTYKVYKPEKDSYGEWYCRVEVSRCYGHNLGKESYDDKNSHRTKNSLGFLFVSVLGHDRDVAEFEKLFSDGYLRLIEK